MISFAYRENRDNRIHKEYSYIREHRNSIDHGWYTFDGK